MPRGRAPKYVRGADRKIVAGLSRNISTGQHYATGSSPRIYFGLDRDEAISRFRAWQSRQERPTVTMPDLRPLIPECDQDACVAEGWITREAAQKLTPWPAGVPIAALYAWARREILTNPTRFGAGVGIAEISRLHDLPPVEESLTLGRVAELYFSRRKTINPRWARETRTHWNAFIHSTTAKTIAELTREDFVRFNTQTWDAGKSETWVKHRLDCVRVILRNVLKSGLDSAHARRVVDLAQLFERPKANGHTNPRPIARQDFHKLLVVADAKWKAVYLLMLNAALYPSEVAAIQKAEIDLDKGVLRARRNKTGRVRVASLWRRTVKAIRAYQKAAPHQSKWLFVSKTGDAYKPTKVVKAFRVLRERAGLPKTVTLDQLRDSAYTAAVEGGAEINAAKALMGHATGIGDHYLLRGPQLVADACAAIERAYFGQPSPAKVACLG